MEVVSVHLAGVAISLLSNFNILNSTCRRLTVTANVQVPHPIYHSSEVLISLNLCVYNSVPFHEVSQGHTSLTIERVIGTVKRGEQVQKVESGLLHSLDVVKNVWVPCRVEFVFNFVKFKLAVSVSIEVVKCLLDQILTDLSQLTIQIIKEGLVIDLAQLLEVVNTENHFQITRLQVCHFHIVEGFQPIVQGKEASVFCIKYFKLSFKGDESANTSNG